MNDDTDLRICALQHEIDLHVQRASAQERLVEVLQNLAALQQERIRHLEAALAEALCLHS
jgi:hypothetical protein